MPRIYDHEIDELLRKGMHEEIESFQYPDPDVLWGKILQRATREQKTKISQRRHMVVTAAAVVLISCIGFLGTNASADTWQMQISNWIRTQLGMTRQKVAFTVKQPGGVPDMHGQVTGKRNTLNKVTLAQAQSAFEIPLLLLAKRPGTRLDSVYLEKLGPSVIIELNYELQDAKHLKVRETRVGYTATGGMTVDSDDSRITKVDVNGNAGTLTVFKNGWTRVEWASRQVLYDLNGQLSSEDILDLAQDMMKGTPRIP